MDACQRSQAVNPSIPSSVHFQSLPPHKPPWRIVNHTHPSLPLRDMPIGPSLPPHLAHLAARRSPSPPNPALLSDDEDEDSYGPALPPHILAARQADPKPIAGPSKPARLPQPTGPIVPSRPAEIEDEEDDDVIGPRPTPSGTAEGGSAVQEFLEREARWAREREVGRAFPQVLVWGEVVEVDWVLLV